MRGVLVCFMDASSPHFACQIPAAWPAPVTDRHAAFDERPIRGHGDGRSGDPGNRGSSPSDLICLADIAPASNSASPIWSSFSASCGGPGWFARRVALAAAIALHARHARSRSPTSSRRWTSRSRRHAARSERRLHVRAAPPRGGGGEKCQTHDLWFELGRQIALFLCGITLADVVRACDGPRQRAR